MNRQVVDRALIAVAALALVTATTLARADTFLFVEGVPGESTDAEHRDWIDLVKFGQTLEPATRRHASVCEGVAIKSLDAASPALWSAVATQTPFTQMIVEITAGSAEEPIVVFRQVMQNVSVARVQFGELEDRPIEKVTLGPEQVSVLYRKLNADGSVGGEITGFVDCRSR